MPMRRRGIDTPHGRAYLAGMFNTEDPEDRQIRFILISGAVVAVLGFLFTALIIAVMVSMNFNILNWME